MVFCINTKQMIAAICTCGLTGFMSLAGAASAPLCKHVLVSMNISEAKVLDTIIDMARMQIEIDLDKVNADNIMASMFIKVLPEKIQELSLYTQKSESEIRSLIKERVGELRKQDTKEKEQEQVGRDQESEIDMKLDIFPFMPGTKFLRFKADTRNVITIAENKDLVSVSLKNGKTAVLKKDVELAYLDKSQQHLVVIDRDRNLVHLDADTGKVVLSEKLSLENGYTKWAVSPSENHAIVFGEINIFGRNSVPAKLLNLKTGSLSNLPEILETHHDFLMISDKEFIVSVESLASFKRVDLSTGESRNYYSTSEKISEFKLSPDGSTMFWNSWQQKSGLLNLSDLDNSQGTAKEFMSRFSFADFSPDSSRLIINSNGSNLWSYSLKTRQEEILWNQKEKVFTQFPPLFDSLTSEVIQISTDRMDSSHIDYVIDYIN